MPLLLLRLFGAMPGKTSALCLAQLASSGMLSSVRIVAILSHKHTQSANVGIDMTSQVAILNKSGVAIASDTITTLEVGQSVKTLPNSHKVFDLGEKHNVLVLNSNLATVCGVSVGTLLAAWARTLNEPLDDLADYPSEFMAFLQALDQEKLPGSRQELRSFIEQRLRYLADDVAQHFEGQKPWFEEVKTKTGLDVKYRNSYRHRVSRAVASYAEWLEQLAGPGFDFETKDLNVSFMDAGVSELAEAWFPDYACPAATRVRLLKCLSLAYKKLGLYGTLTSLGFVGYGKENFYPKVADIEIQQVIPGAARWQLKAIQDPTHHDTAVLWWWAQTDAVESFLKGFHPSFVQDLREKVKQAVIDDRESDYEDPSEFSQDEKDIWGSIGEGVFTQLEKYIAQYAESHYDNFLMTFSHMDVAELAKVSASFLDMQILSTHNAMELPTVGGLVEVATINLASGIVWRSKLTE